jgi:hypothetical protein
MGRPNGLPMLFREMLPLSRLQIALSTSVDRQKI